MDIKNLTSAYNALTPAEQEEFLNGINAILKPKSTKFNRTDITVAVPAQMGTFNNQKDTTSILKLKKDGGLFDYIGDNISGWEFDNNPIYEGCEAASGVVDKFLNDMEHCDIIAEGELLQCHKKYNMWQAQLLANALVEAGAINVKNSLVIIYLTETINGAACRLNVWRGDDGDVEVHVGRVDFDDPYYAGKGVLSSN